LRVNLKWQRLDQGGADDIREWVSETRAKGRSVAFVAIDTFAYVRQPGDPRKAYESDVAAMAAVKDLAAELNIAIIVVHHLRKQGSDDPMDVISGTLGLTGTADTIIVIGSGPSGVVFHVKGRDVEESDLAVEFNKTNCKWTILGDAEVVRQTETKAKIQAALRDVFPSTMTPKEVTEVTGLTENTIRVTLRRMVEKQEIRSPERGRYVFSGS
jgi:hypothetical protein